MLKETFLTKANQMGDFYAYYTKPTGQKAYAVCTIQLDEDYMQSKLKKFKCKSDEVIVWNWNYSGPMALKVRNVSKLVPLSQILKN